MRTYGPARCSEAATRNLSSGAVRRDVCRCPLVCVRSTILDSLHSIIIFALCHKEHLGPGYLGYRSAHLDDGSAKGTICRTRNGGVRPLELRTRCYCEHIDQRTVPTRVPCVLVPEKAVITDQCGSSPRGVRCSTIAVPVRERTAIALRVLQL